MKISLSPQRRDDTLEVVKDGDSLILNGEVFDFSPLKDGQTLPQSAMNSIWFAGDVFREEGELNITLLLPHGINPTKSQAFPEIITNIPDGVVTLPQGD